jgi:DNA-binding NarL/FixJ family response regulator
MVEDGDMLENSIMVIEDDSFTRSTLCAALRSLGLNVVAESGSSREALVLGRTHLPSAALIDLDLGKGPTGIDLAIALRRIKRDIGIVFLTSYDDPRFLRSSLPPLPVGSQYMVKKSVAEIATVKRAIENAIASATQTSSGSRAPQSGEQVNLSELTDIQVETLRLVSQGLTNSEIAKLRFINVKSVEQTINRIAKILNLPQDITHNQRVHMARVFFRSSGSAPNE